MNNKYNIEEIKLLIPDYVTGSLDENEKRIVEEALKNSDELRAIHSSAVNAFTFMKSVKYEQPPANYFNTLIPKIHERIEAKEDSAWLKNPLGVIWKIVLPVAAIVLIFVAYTIIKNSNEQITKDEKKEQKQEQIKQEKKIEPKQEIKIENKVVEDNSKQNTPKVKNDKSFRENENQNYSNEVKENSKQDDNKIKTEENEVALTDDESTLNGIGESAGYDEELDKELNTLDSKEKQLLIDQLLKSNL